MVKKVKHLVSQRNTHTVFVSRLTDPARATLLVNIGQLHQWDVHQSAC